MLYAADALKGEHTLEVQQIGVSYVKSGSLTRAFVFFRADRRQPPQNHHFGLSCQNGCELRDGAWLKVATPVRDAPAAVWDLNSNVCGNPILKVFL